MHTQQPVKKSFFSYLQAVLSMAIGAFLTAFALEVFLLPNNLIDGGIVGIAMISGKFVGDHWIPVLILLFNTPFIALAFKSIGKSFVIHMMIANVLLSLSLYGIGEYLHGWQFKGESLEVVVIGGAILGVGIGLIIRAGGCLDGTEILAILMSQQKGYTVGQVVLICNLLIFSVVGLIFQDWHPPILSLINYMVAVRVMDTVIVGLDETKSVIIISSKSKDISEQLVHDLGLGLTVMYGRGGYSGKEREILYVIAERLQLAELKEVVHREDPAAFIAIKNLHEVVNARHGGLLSDSNVSKNISVSATGTS